MLDRELILSAFAALDQELRRTGDRGRVVVAGGAALVLGHQARAATKDVDAILLTPSEPLNRAACLVAAELKLPIDWLNDRARVFAGEVASGAVVYSSSTLDVRLADPILLLAMKLSAMRDSIDYADARTVLASIAGTREEIWTRVEPLLDPSQPEWKRQNFDALWRELHGHP